MQWETRVTIAGQVDDVMAVATTIERWPVLLPTYRWVRFHGRSGAGRAYQITAWLGPLPVQWTTEQVVDARQHRLVYRHLLGPTRGLRSEWRLTQVDDVVDVTVRSDWQPTTPLVGPLLATLLGRVAIEPLTQRTLVEVAAVVASGHAAALRRLNAAYETAALDEPATDAEVQPVERPPV